MLQLRNKTLIELLNIKSIEVLKVETKKYIKNGLGKNSAKSYLLTGKTHEDFL